MTVGPPHEMETICAYGFWSKLQVRNLKSPFLKLPLSPREEARGGTSSVLHGGSTASQA